MLGNFGLDRAIEPKGAVPVTAWKLDNQTAVRPDELRISVERIHVERDSFHQICSECSYEPERVKHKIMDLVEKRGKLHNPFTNGGGILYGTVTAIGHRFPGDRQMKVGDQIIVTATAAGIPLLLEEIREIDFHYGGLLVKGEATLFETTHIIHRPEGLSLNYTMAALDEASVFEAINEAVQEDMEVMLIGRDLTAMLLYAGSLRGLYGSKISILGVMDTEVLRNFDRMEIEALLECCIDRLFLTDISKPVESYETLYEMTGKPVDITINTEDLTGSETLSVLITKPKGSIFFTNLQAGYSTAVLVAESMEKELRTYTLDQYAESCLESSLTAVNYMKPHLEKLNRIYQKQEQRGKLPERKIKEAYSKKTVKMDDFVFRSPVTRQMIDEVINIAGYDCNAIIQGETGVGKEKILELIHKNSARKNQPCIKINCATIQETLAESEFFGYEAGAFTGAQATGKRGYFELANHGVLFLDEIGQLSLQMQSKLLRVLQENQFYRIGGTRQLSVNVRVICANNIPLKALVKKGLFREDLYYRLNICTIHVPPLRERTEDIPALAEYFLTAYNRKYGTQKYFSAEGLKRLCHYHWPGNVRQLENGVHRMIIGNKMDLLDEEQVNQVLEDDLYRELVLDIEKILENGERFSFKDIVESQEKKLIAYALKKEGTTRKAAEFLSMTQAQLARKKLKYEL